MRSRREGDASVRPGGADSLDEEAFLRRIRSDLGEIGLLGDEAERIAEAILEQLRLTGPDGYEDLLAGVRFSHQARTDAAAELAQMQRELKQLERLMGGFATELRKLDEVLEVLAAYVRRMRTSVGEGTKQILH
jgi:hypothetical protein